MEVGKTPSNNKLPLVFMSLCLITICNCLLPPGLGIGKGYARPCISIKSNNKTLYNLPARISRSTGCSIEIAKGSTEKLIPAATEKLTLTRRFYTISKPC